MAEVNYKDKKFINRCYKEDPLWFEWFLSCGIFRYKIVRLTLILNILFNILKYILQICYFKNHLSYFVRYGLLFFGEPYAVAAEVAILWKREEMENCFDSIPLWTYDSCGEKLKRQINRNMKLHAFVVYTVLILIAVAGWVTFYPSPSDLKHLFPVFMIEKHLPKPISTVLSWAYKSTLLPMGYCAMVHPLTVMYGSMHVIYQNVMLAEHYRGIIATGFEDEDKEKLICNREIQNAMHDRIVFCIKRQIQEIEYARKSIDLVQDLFAVLIPFWYSAGFGVLMFYFSCKLRYIEYTIDDMLFPSLCCFNAITMFIGLVICGQMTEDASGMLLEAVQEWEWWALDVRNRNTMLIILSGTKNFKMQFSQNFVINYNLAVNMTKTIYSLTSLIATVEKFQ